MTRQFQPLLLATALALVTGIRAHGQPPSLPSAPVPVAPAAAQEGQVPDGAPAPPIPPSPYPTLPGPFVPPPPVPPPPSSYQLYQDNNGRLLRGDPLLDRPELPPPGWFAGVEVTILGPHVKNRLQAPVTIEGFEPNTVALPGAPLDWTGSPRFELGYRLAAGLGEIAVSYRNIVSEGSDVLPGFDLDG